MKIQSIGTGRILLIAIAIAVIGFTVGGLKSSPASQPSRGRTGALRSA